jgi:hypothetical protein
MSSSPTSELVPLSRRDGDGEPLRRQAAAGPGQGGRVELRETGEGAEGAVDTILLPVAVAAVFLVVLVLGAIVG